MNPNYHESREALPQHDEREDTKPYLMREPFATVSSVSAGTLVLNVSGKPQGNVEYIFTNFPEYKVINFTSDEKEDIRKE